MRGLAPPLCALVCLPAAACRALVDPDVSYHDCPTDQGESFLEPTTFETLREGCWQLDNANNDPSDVFVFDGDLVIRVNEPINGHREQWLGADQAPMVYRVVEKDFLLMARVEAVHKITGDHCLPQGNMAGLVLRRQDTSDWATYMIGPFDVEAHDCSDESPDPPPTMAALRSRDERWGADVVDRGVDMEGIGDDGEADLVMCRVDSQVDYYYRDAEAGLEQPRWIQLLERPIDVGEGPLEVGMTAGGADPSYAVEAHVDWAVLDQGSVGDGCRGALEQLKLPDE
jgi:hypothetical protein